MALVAVHAVVYVSADALVILVGLILGVAVRALKDGIIIRIDVAGRAHAIRVAVISWELRVLGMVEGRIQPARRGVASLASGREELRLCRVSRIRGAVVIGLMAADASCRQGRVIVVDVTVHAQTRRRSVHAGQWEGRVVVVKHPIRPQHRVVTQLASRRESCRDVVHRGESVVVIGLMAAHAGSSGDVVVAVDVATRTLQRRHRVRPG